MASIVKIPLYENVSSVNQTEEDAIKQSIIDSSSSFNGQIWNSTINKTRVWNASLQAFENTVKVENIFNHVIVKQLSDFPTPDANGFTCTADNTTYQISGTVSGDLKFKLGVKTSFVGIDRVNDRLLSTTTGVVFDMDGTTTSKSNILFSDITIGAANGTLFNVVSSAQNQAVGMISVTISATKNLGIMNNISTWAMTNIVIRNCVTTQGFVITGNNGTIKNRLGVFGNNVGTLFDFTGSTNEMIDFNNNQISSSSGQTFMSAIPSNVTVWGKLNNNSFTGVGNYITGVTGSSNLWNFSDNLGITNTPSSGGVTEEASIYNAMIY